ncbi:MAG: 16S rRNA (cytosine(967)-C(5))-methyltransferase RsmB [Verrucomicrobia bacterium]|nr:16S rRNA (cytosine(967)-C(5))-methyltransferase RsmB [Verrucomicrobiota bacterium]
MAALLRRWEQGRSAADDLLHDALAGTALDERDRALTTELFYGCLRQRAALDWLAAQKSRHGALKPAVAVLARLGLYQLFFLDRIPAHAAVNETVELAKKHLSPRETGFINALLRAAERERATLKAALDHQPLPVRLSHPAWLVERWTARYGEAGARTLLEWNNTPPKLFARLNTLRTTADALLSKWREAGIEAALTSGNLWQQPMIELKGACAPERLPGFSEGAFYVQDPSTLLAVELLDPQPGARVLDACAAPGGKATLIAAMMQNRGEIVAEDSSAERLKLVVANCARLSVTSVTVRSARPPDAKETWFDRVLLDVPCSNTGVLRRRVDARWRLRPDDIARLAAEQLRLLQASARRVRRGGVLVYSTCSLEPEENRGVVEAFTKGNAEFALEKVVETFPPRDGVDGTFAARLSRRR